MDGFRKVPDNVPNRDMLSAYIDQLTKVPDPFDEHPSTASYNSNAFWTALVLIMNL